MRATKTERKRRKEEKIKEMKGKRKVLNLKASHDPSPLKLSLTQEKRNLQA